MIILLTLAIFSVVLHELGHGYAALALGDSTAKQQNRLSLNPIHHIDPIYTILMPIALLMLFGTPLGAAKPVPVNPNYFKFTSARRGMMLVAAAGPLVNFTLCLLALFLIFLGQENHHLLTKYLLFQFFIVNAILMSLNLIPIPPLDGSKILFGLLPRHLALKLMRSYKIRTCAPLLVGQVL